VRRVEKRDGAVAEEGDGMLRGERGGRTGRTGLRVKADEAREEGGM
jgi:hypothetical protein